MGDAAKGWRCPTCGAPLERWWWKPEQMGCSARSGAHGDRVYRVGERGKLVDITEQVDREAREGRHG